MMGEYTLAKVVARVRKNGTVGAPSYYAHVSIDVEQSSQECNASDAVGDEVDRNVGEVNAKTYQA